ncbi:unnamed protein product [Ambrosiozyma monospora]|uniref:pyridoxal 5'-phosphate synthase n=1 Tax=Ambrosiozyma monospora TaxID=43982 RepID=A0A9W7DC83_AMBMO|nr:unnamed protein product [Ambrosiozyma monospora]
MSGTQKTPEEPIIFAPKTYQYGKFKIGDHELLPSPIDQFSKWFKEAQEKKLDLPECTTLSTAELPSGRISSRVVLLKELDHKGFIVYSNLDTSRKIQDLKTNKHAALNFFWKDLQRQVRVEGIVEFVDYETSSRYYKTRPRGSKIGAWASPQTTVISGREELNERYQKFEEKFKDVADDEIPCPEKWGGIRVVPLEVEMWQGGKSRLHDRFVYRREKITDDKWELVRLAP